MRIDIAIPAYNEEKVIGEAVNAVRASFEDSGHELHIMVSNNGSTDATAKAATDAGGEILEVPIKGKGAAVRFAAEVSKAPLFGFVDADLSAHPTNLLSFIAILQKESADIVIGSRLMDEGSVHRSYIRTLSSKIFNVIRRQILGVRVLDTQCGLKLMNERGKAALIAGKEIGWFFDIEFLAHAERQGLRIIEVPIAWEEFRIPSRISKLHILRDGAEALRALLRIRHTLH